MTLSYNLQSKARAKDGGSDFELGDERGRAYQQCCLNAIILPCSNAHHRTWLQSKAKAKGDGSEFEVDDEKAELEELAESEAEDDGGTFRLGQQDEEYHDYSALALKEDARNRLDCLAYERIGRRRDICLWQQDEAFHDYRAVTLKEDVRNRWQCCCNHGLRL